MSHQMQSQLTNDLQQKIEKQKKIIQDGEKELKKEHEKLGLLELRVTNVQLHSSISSKKDFIQFAEKELENGPKALAALELEAAKAQITLQAKKDEAQKQAQAAIERKKRYIMQAQAELQRPQNDEDYVLRVQTDLKTAQEELANLELKAMAEKIALQTDKDEAHTRAQTSINRQKKHIVQVEKELKTAQEDLAQLELRAKIVDTKAYIQEVEEMIKETQQNLAQLEHSASGARQSQKHAETEEEEQPGLLVSPLQQVTRDSEKEEEEQKNQAEAAIDKTMLGLLEQEMRQFLDGDLSRNKLVRYAIEFPFEPKYFDPLKVFDADMQREIKNEILVNTHALREKYLVKEKDTLKQKIRGLKEICQTHIGFYESLQAITKSKGQAMPKDDSLHTNVGNATRNLGKIEGLEQDFDRITSENAIMDEKNPLNVYKHHEAFKLLERLFEDQRRYCLPFLNTLAEANKTYPKRLEEARMQPENREVIELNARIAASLAMEGSLSRRHLSEMNPVAPVLRFSQPQQRQGEPHVAAPGGEPQHPKEEYDVVAPGGPV